MRKERSRPANFLIFVFCLFFVSFSVLFVCICVLYYCHRVATQLQLNIYHINIYGNSITTRTITTGEVRFYNFQIIAVSLKDQTSIKNKSQYLDSLTISEHVYT
jgi:hypothetical protein